MNPLEFSKSDVKRAFETKYPKLTMVLGTCKKIENEMIHL